MELPSYFRQYLAAIQPTRPNRDRAIQLHRTLARRLADDRSFRDWYSSTFLYGSYRRNTAVQPIKDVDICVLLNIDHTKHEPEAVVNRLRRVLDRNGYRDKTNLQRRSIRVDMSGMSLDVVPVVAKDGEDQPLLIPDRPLAKWVTTHPKGHLAEATRLNREANQRYIPFVKIVKAWYRYQLCDLRSAVRPKPKGFTLEALVAQYQDADAPSYAEAFVNFLSNLDVDCGASLAKGEFPDVPDPGLSGKIVTVTFSTDEAKLFGEVVKESLTAARAALLLEPKKESAEAWRAIFGPKFPKAPESAKSMAVDEDVEEVEDGLEEEIRQVELPEPQRLGRLSIRAELAAQKEGKVIQAYPSGSRALTKGMWLRFSVLKTDVWQPYDIYWIVTNHGHEAKLAGDPGHVSQGSTTRWEHTAYRGSHTMTCELRRKGAVLARAHHTVNIK